MKLTQKNYFSKKANLEFMSVSQFKAFQKCQHSALAEIQGKYKPEKTTSLLVGSYVDSWFEGTLEAFKKENPEIFKKDGTLKAEYIQAEAIIQRIQQDTLFKAHMAGEKQVIMTGIIKGVPVKIKIDSFLPDRIVDLKVMKDFEPVYVPEKGVTPFFEAWGYDIQGAVYQEIVRQNTGRRLPFYIAAATKEKITDIDVIELEQDSLDFALGKFEADVELFDAIKKGIIEPERCDKCEWCKLTKKLTAPTKSGDYYFM